MDHNLQAGKNFAWMSVAQVMMRVLGLGFFILMSFLLGERGVGQYGFIASFTLFWFLIIDLGAAGHLYRVWSKGKSTLKEVEYDFNIVFTFRLVITLLIFVPFAIVNYYINADVFIPMILFFISTFFAIFLNLSDLYFNSANKFKYSSIRQVIEKFSIVLFGSVLLYLSPRLEMVFIAMLMGQIISLIYYYFFVLPFKFRLVFNWQRAYPLIVKGLPFLLIGFCTSIYNRIDMIMLRYMGSFEAVGLYSTAYRFLELAGIFSATLFVPSIFPILSSLYNDSKLKDKFLDFFNKSIRILFSSGMFITLFLILFSPILIKMFFPPSFGDSILALRILIMVQVVGSFTVLFSNMLTIQHKEKKGLVIIIISALANVILNIILIPKYSLYGAAWATVLAEVVNLILLQYFVSWKKNIKFILNMFIIVLVNGLILSTMKFSGQLNNIWLSSAVMLINIFVFYKMKLLRKNDIDLFFNPLKLKFNNIFNRNI